MTGKTRPGWLIVVALALVLATGVGGTGPLKPGSVAALSGGGSPSGETFVINGGFYCC